MLDKTKTVQGLTLYAEFSKEGFRSEFFMTPDGFTAEGTPVPAKVFRRTLSADKPKKLWSATTLRPATEIAEIGVKDLADSDKEAYIEKRIENINQIFQGFIQGDWTLINEPFLIETSQKDLADIAKGETPIKVVYRINQSRKALGFPVEIA
jgi:hypothetical protein